MRFKWTTIAVTLAAFVISIFGMRFVEQQFFPTSDRPEVLVDVGLRQNASIAATRELMDKPESQLKDDPEFLASWSAITHVQRLQLIVDLAKEYQAAASASAAVSGWKKAAHAGKNPTPAQWKAFYALPANKKADMLSAVHAAAGPKPIPNQNTEPNPEQT